MIEEKLTPKENKDKCEKCGATDDLIFTEDPYYAEMNDIHEKICMCTECYYSSMGDI